MSTDAAVQCLEAIVSLFLMFSIDAEAEWVLMETLNPPKSEYYEYFKIDHSKLLLPRLSEDFKLDVRQSILHFFLLH